jgi:hypothetical protein
MKASFAYIMITHRAPLKKAPLKIADQGIGFFIPPIASYSEFACNAGDTVQWELSFFRMSPANVRLRVVFTAFPLHEQDAIHCQALARVGWWEQPLSSDAKTTNQLAVSQFLCRSNVLPTDAFTLLGKQCHMASNRNGVALVGTSYEQFQRIVICQALAAAYHHVMTKKMRALSEHLKHQRFDALAKLHEEVLAFNASDFFAQPVGTCRQPLNNAWSHLTTHWQLDTHNQQLTAQLSDISNLLHAKRERHAQQRREARYQQERIEQQHQQAERAATQEAHARRALRIDVTLGLIGVLSILSLVQVTPSDIGQFLGAWAALLLS